jgi:hypothetical protein
MHVGYFLFFKGPKATIGAIAGNAFSPDTIGNNTCRRATALPNFPLHFYKRGCTTPVEVIGETCLLIV